MHLSSLSALIFFKLVFSSVFSGEFSSQFYFQVWDLMYFPHSGYKKVFNDPDNHDGVITHVEPDIQECAVKWALGSITTNGASRGAGIPAELCQILKMMLLKCCTQCVSKFVKLSSGHRTGNDLFSFQSQRKAISKNVQTPIQLHSFHMLEG